MRRALLDRLLADRARERTVVLCTRLPDGAQRLIYPLEEEPWGVGEASLEGDVLLDAARRAARDDRSGPVDVDVDGGEGETGDAGDAGDGIFLRVYNPSLRLVLVGAVHIAQALAPMAALAGFRVVVVDPRRAFATPGRFPEVELRAAWPAEALEELAPDHRTAVVTLTHDPKLDDPALQAALASDAFYVGALGSRRTHARRLERLREAGVGEAALARIHGPVGLEIGARTPAEIAVSVLAQAVERLRREEGA